MKPSVQLRTRLAIAGLLLIGTTVATGVWGVTAFRRVSQVTGDTVTANERVTDATAALAGALEREDDAMLLALSDPERGRAQLAHQRKEVDAALAQVIPMLEGPAVSARLTRDIDAYEAAADQLVASA